MYVVYYRELTDKQGESGLGMQAQIEAFDRIIAAEPNAEVFGSVVFNNHARVPCPKGDVAIFGLFKKKEPQVVTELLSRIDELKKGAPPNLGAVASPVFDSMTIAVKTKWTRKNIQDY